MSGLGLLAGGAGIALSGGSSDSNAAPEVHSEVEKTPEDTPVSGNLLKNDTDSDGDELRITEFTVNGQTYVPADGKVDIPGVGSIIIDENGDYIFTPIPDWNGMVPTITYTVSDGKHGTVTINDDGTITYTPNDGYVGKDEYTYTVTSGGVTETTTVKVTVTNEKPIVAPEKETTPEDTPLIGNVLKNDTDADGDKLTVIEFKVGDKSYQAGEKADIPGVGTININENGDYCFTPVPDWNGKVPTITYIVSDGNDGGVSTSTLGIEVTPVEDIVADNETSHAGTPVTTNVLENDNFDNPDAKVTDVTDGKHGTVTINDDGTVTYTPKAGYLCR